MDKKYVVYQHVTPDNMYYFGATSNIKRRWRNNGAEYKGTALQPYIEQYGWDNIQHIVLFRDQTRENALWIEDFLIETAREDGVCINKNRSGLVSKEEGYKQQIFKQYYEKNRDKKLEQDKQYYEKNKEKRLEYRRQYYEKNKDKISEYKQDYYERNKDKILEHQREYQKQNKDKKSEYDRQRYQKNRDKIREYHRQYYQRKKLEKQLKEVETTTLF